MQVTMIEPPVPPSRPAYIATTESQRSTEAPPQPVFDSDKDTRAAAESPATGNLPLPSQEGEEPSSTAPTAFENREYTPGKKPQESAPTSAPARPAEPVPPTPRTVTKPEPPTPTPAKPASQPTPQFPVGTVALLQPLRPQTQTRPETPRPTRPADQPGESAQAPVQPATPARTGYQPQTRITRLRGNISNRGRASVDAAATPLGRYKKQMSDAIGSRWYYYVNEAISLLNTGTVEMRFVVRSDGKVERLQILRNSSNESFASTSARAVTEAEIPPIPDELLPMLNNGRIEVDYTFTILPN